MLNVGIQRMPTLNSAGIYVGYKYYAFTADGNFYIISRIDQTMLYCVADSAYKDEIIGHIEKLGYK